MIGLRYLSVCSGIEAATVAWHPLGWTAVGFSEIEAFPSAVLAHHYPDVPNLGDMTRFKDWPDAAIDLLVGGTPCQSFSVAGLRKGLADPRGNLALTYLAIADRYRPEWLVWENVPGVLSSDGGRDFGSIVGAMVELGYSPAWRVLDAQYVRVDGFARAVPQRRRRVFVVGHLGDWRRAAAVLFEPESLSGDSAPRRQAGERTAGTIGASLRGGGGIDSDFGSGLIPAAAGTLGQDHGNIRADQAWSDRLIPSTGDIAHCLNAGGMGRQDYETEAETVIAHALRADGFDASEDGTGRGTPLVTIPFDTTNMTSPGNYSNPQPGDPMHPLTVKGHVPAVAMTITRGAESSGKGGYAGRRQEDDSNIVAAFNITPSNSNKDYNARKAAYAQAVTTQGGAPSARGGDIVTSGWAVRRLTPTECERLQGFPDGYTSILYRKRQRAADGPRYKALGNSMAVNSMRWLGTRIDMVRGIVAELERPAA